MRERVGIGFAVVGRAQIVAGVARVVAEAHALALDDGATQLLRFRWCWRVMPMTVRLASISTAASDCCAMVTKALERSLPPSASIRSKASSLHQIVEVVT